MNHGSFGTPCVASEGTGPLLTSRFGLPNHLLTASYCQRDFAVDWTLARHEEYCLALDHRFKNGAKPMLTAEYFKPPRPAPSRSLAVRDDTSRFVSGPSTCPGP